jgi:hypothetical protein
MMKNLHICISILLLIAGLNGSLTAQPQYYNYNTGGSGSNSFPFNMPAGKDVQLLYLAGDFNQPTPAPAGNITSISLFISPSYSLGPWTYTDFTIKMGQSTITTFVSGSLYSGTLTTVYYRASVSLSGAAGTWMTITLDAPFAYDPTQSLIVDIGQCAVPGATGFSMAFTTLTGNRRIWSTGGCPFTYGGVNSAIYHMGINIASDPPAVVTTAATNITPTSATLNGTVNANGASTTVNFEYGLTAAYGNTVPGVPSPVTGSIVTPVSAAISGLIPNTVYHFRVTGTNIAGTSYGDDMTFMSDPLYYNYNTNGSNNSFPMNMVSGKDVQLLYLPGDFNQPIPAPVGNISSISLRIADTYPLGPWTYTDLTIKMGQSAITSFTAGSFYTGSLTTVYYRSSVLLSAPGGTWLTIDLDTPFAYDPTQSLIVDLGQCGVPGATGFSACFTNLTDNRRIWSVGGCPFTYSGVNSSVYHMGLTVDCPMPGPPGTIAGPATVCENTAGHVYSVAPVLNATSYTWTIPPGAVITAGMNTETITVTFGTSPGNVTVCGVSACGNGPTASLAVSVVPSPVPTITGSNNMCVNSGYYGYTTEAGMTNYTWTTSSGGTVMSGQGTYQAYVNWLGSGPQSVSVNYTITGGCSAAAPTLYAVTVDPAPGAAGTITGTASACGGATGIAYSVAPVADAVTYVWTLPAGAAIASGEWTNAITVDFAPDASSGNITVYGNNLCGNGTVSPPFVVTVTPLPTDAGTISGPASVCAGDAGVNYSVPAITNATGYTWTVPSGASIASGSNTNSIMVDFGAAAVSGNITVLGTNTCGNGGLSPDFPVTVNQVPPAPVITFDGNTLTSDAPAGNQWYLDGTVIPGATGQTHIPTQSGIYTCMVTLNGCSSPASNEINVVMTGIAEKGIDAAVSVYPNPGEGLFTLQIRSGKQETFTIQVFNNLGVMIRELDGIEVKGTVEKVLDLRPAADGIYTVVVRNSNARIVKKVVVNN